MLCDAAELKGEKQKETHVVGIPSSPPLSPPPPLLPPSPPHIR